MKGCEMELYKPLNTLFTNVGPKHGLGPLEHPNTTKPTEQPCHHTSERQYILSSIYGISRSVRNCPELVILQSKRY